MDEIIIFKLYRSASVREQAGKKIQSPYVICDASSLVCEKYLRMAMEYSSENGRSVVTQSQSYSAPT